MPSFPKDLILMLSGVPCVGKTTTAYQLLKNFPEFRRVSELDILRTMARAVADDAMDACDYTEEKNLKQYFSPLYYSVSSGDFAAMKQQSKFMVKYIREIVKRQQARKIPTIIEGSCIVPSTYFIQGIPIEGFEKNILFVNLYLSDEKEHLSRRLLRCQERDYPKNFHAEEKIKKLRDENIQLHLDTLYLQGIVNNVFSIDISGLDTYALIRTIFDLIDSHFR